MLVLTPSSLLAPSGFVNTFPAFKADHLKVQRAFFGTARSFFLSEDKQLQLDGINSLLGLSITSRTQLSPRAYEVLIAAIEAGAFNERWELTGRVHAEVEIHLVGSDPEPVLCHNCKERPVQYLFEDGELADGEQGICRECMTPQSPDEDDLMNAEVALYKATFSASPTLEEFEAMFDDYDRALELEQAREEALAPVQARAEFLRRSVKCYQSILDDSCAVHSRYQKRSLRRLRNTAQGELIRLEREYPFI